MMLAMMNSADAYLRLAFFAAIFFIAGCASDNSNRAFDAHSEPHNSQITVGNAVMITLIQRMAGSVLNGKISSQLTPSDQIFRLQQFGRLLQTGKFNQTQQWLNPQTGSVITLNPVGQQTINQKTLQSCLDLVEILYLKNGTRIQENRRACLMAEIGQWNLVQ